MLLFEEERGLSAAAALVRRGEGGALGLEVDILLDEVRTLSSARRHFLSFLWEGCEGGACCVTQRLSGCGHACDGGCILAIR